MYNRKEIIWVTIIIIFALFCSVAPYLYGYYAAPPNTIYLGIRLNNFPDTNSYLNWITQGSEGHFLFKQLYSIEGSVRSFFHPLFLLLGILMNFLGGKAILWYHIGRVIGAAILFVTGYKLITYLVEEWKWRLVALIIFIFSSGLGWLFTFSADNTQLEVTNFINFYESLINTYSLILILWTIIFFYYKNLRSSHSILICSLLLNFLILIHSYDFIVVTMILAIISVYSYFKKRDSEFLRKFLYIIALCFPAMFVQLYTLYTNAALGIWATMQSAVPAVPSTFYYLSGIGLQIIFIIIGLFAIPSQKREKWLPWIIWLVLLPLFLWNPLWAKYQRKLLIGAFVPLTLLTFAGLQWWYLKTREHIGFKPVALGGLASMIILLCLSNVTLVSNDIEYINQRYGFVSDDAYSAILYLKDKPDSTVLTGDFIGNILPGFTGNTVFLGHYDQTVDFDTKYGLVQKLLASKFSARDPLKFFVKQEGINYIFVDEEVRSWGGLDTTNRPYLKLVYENSDVQIYHVEKDLLN